MKSTVSLLVTFCAAITSAAGAEPLPKTLGKGVTLSETTWKGDVRPGLKSIVMENARLRATIQRNGAYIASVVNKLNGGEFVHCTKANKCWRNGIYDRIDVNGRHNGNPSVPTHLANHEYLAEPAGPGTLRFTCRTEAVEVVRTIQLHPSLPKMRIEVTYTSLSPELAKMGIILLSQFNLSNAPVSYNQVVVMPGEKKPQRFVAEGGGHYGETVKSGWWLAADRESKKSIVMSYPTDGSAESIYLYRVANWIHLLPFGPVKLMNKGDKLSLWQEYLFLGDQKEAEAIAPADVSVSANEFKRLKAALIEELSTPPVKAGQPRTVKLPEVPENSEIEPPPEGKPEASVIFLRNAVYDHHSQLDRRTWHSLDQTLAALAEIRESQAGLLVVSGASYNGLEREFRLVHEAAELSGKEIAYGTNGADAKDAEAFEKTLGPRNWARKIRDVTLIHFTPGETEWLEQAIAKAAGSRIVVMGDRVPTGLAAKTKVNLAILPLPTSMPSFERVGNWPVLSVPRVQDYPSFAVVNIFPDHLDVFIKPLGRTFGPRLYLDREGKSPTLGVPSFVQGEPVLKVAHMGDTQLNVPSRVKTADGQPLDQHNMKLAITEMNALGVDFAVNAGDLVNRGADEEQWKLYLELKKPLKMPLYEVLGNHDWNETTPEGRTIATNYEKYCDDPLIYDFEKNGVFFMVFGTAVSKGADLRQRLAKARRARCTVLLYHDPISTVKGYNWWTKDLYDAAHELQPTISLAGHTHRLQWNQSSPMREFVSSAIAWTKTGDPKWNGFFVHSFFEDRVVSAYKRFGCDDLFFTVVTPYREK